MADSGAIFDLDGTLVVGQTQALMIQFLRRHGVVSRWFVARFVLWFLGYKVGLVKITQESRAKAAQCVAGLAKEKADELMDRLVQEDLVPRFHPAATAAVAEHLAEGDKVAVVSAALDPLVRALCRRLGITEWACADCELVDGRYTGRLAGPAPYGPLKVKAAADLIAKWGADPAECWAYADTMSDVDLLRSVGHPVAVNPQPELRIEAERLGWPVLL
jgi:HAD superfamily hydrolase (TIGR01490 family)